MNGAPELIPELLLFAPIHRSISIYKYLNKYLL